jgi:hypothetical protein
MLTVGGRVTMLLLMQAMGMLTMLLLMRATVMHVVEAAASGAAAGEVDMVASLIISKMEGEVAMVASVIISTMEVIMMRHQHRPEVGAVVSGAVAGEEVAMVASPIISKMVGITMRHLLHQLQVRTTSFSYQIGCRHTSLVKLFHICCAAGRGRGRGRGPARGRGRGGNTNGMVYAAASSA